MFFATPVVSLLGQTEVNKVKNVLPFLKLLKCPKTKFHTHTMRESQVIRSKKVKIYRWVKIFCNSFFLFIDILFKLQQLILICVASLVAVIIMSLLRFLT